MEEILKHRHLQEIKKIFISAAGKKTGHEAEAVKAGAYRSCRPNRGRTEAEQWRNLFSTFRLEESRTVNFSTFNITKAKINTLKGFSPEPIILQYSTLPSEFYSHIEQNFLRMAAPSG